MKSGQIQAVVVNSGNANASTARPGLQLARDTCAFVGQTLGISGKLVFPSSTGKIGVLPAWEKIQAGIQAASAALSVHGFWPALAGIMTTDAFPKVSTRQLVIDGN